MIIDNLTTEVDSVTHESGGFIDSDILMKLAQEQGLECEPSFLKTYRSIRNSELQLAVQRQYEDCEQCNKDNPCCNANCELFDKLKERKFAKWKEDIKMGGIDPCRQCPSEGICQKEEQCYTLRKMNRKVKFSEWKKIIELPSTLKEEVIENLTLKSSVIKEDLRVKLEDFNFSYSDKISYRAKTEIASLGGRIDINTPLDKAVAKELSDIVKTKLEKLYSPYKQGSKEYMSNEIDQKKQSIIERLRAEIHQNSNKINYVKEKITKFREDVCICLVDVNGKINDGATGSIVYKYGLYAEYVKHCSSVGRYHKGNLVGDIQSFRRRGKNIILIYVDSSSEKIDELRRSLQRIDDMECDIAIAGYDILSRGRMKSIIKGLKNSFNIYNPFTQQ